MTNLTTFGELGLSKKTLESLSKKGFEKPTPIQEKTIPFLLQNDQDLIGKAQTGTGKTAAFGIPLIEKLEPNAKNVQAVILAPTRELAIQVAKELESFSYDNSTRIAAIYGGQAIDRQISALRRGVDIVVGTPGRILDHLQRKTLNISQISHLVLDEADEMLNMGFVEDLEEILKSAPSTRRTILFSATMPKHIERLAKKYMANYQIISTTPKNVDKSNIEQIYFEVSQRDKFEALFRIIDVEEGFYGMVFCRTKVEVDQIAQKLYNRNLRAEAIHGDLSQAQREKVLQKFRSKKVTILVATDVAARGIDVDDLTHVINYALPQDPESYVHRIGRTGRAGKKGIAVNLITPSQYRSLMTIQKVANMTITKQKLPDVTQVISSKKQRIKTLISQTIEQQNFDDSQEIINEILEENSDPKLVIAALLRLKFKNDLNHKSYNDIDQSQKEQIYTEEKPRRGRNNDNKRRSNFDDRSGTRLFIAKGRIDNFNPKKLVDFIQKQSGVNQRSINDVQMFDKFSFFAVEPKDADKILNKFQQNSSNKRSLVTRAKAKTQKPKY